MSSPRKYRVITCGRIPHHRVASRRISFLLKLFGRRTAVAVMALGLALILAGLFEEAGLAMIIGAYVMGLSLSRSDISHMVREKLAPVYELMTAVPNYEDTLLRGNHPNDAGYQLVRDAFFEAVSELLRSGKVY